MSIPPLKYPLTSQNYRVIGYEIPSEEQPKIYNCENLLSKTEMDELIYAAYRQIWNEQQILRSNRQRELESQLRSSQITVRDFIRGLALSETFQKRNYQVNNNYRFVKMCVQRLLGRDVHNEREKLSWSIILATLGLEGFVDALLNSEEYMDNFGYDIVPYQRRRILPQRTIGEYPFARMPRYGKDHRQTLLSMGYFRQEEQPLSWEKTPYYNILRPIGAVITIIGALILVSLVIAIALAAWEIIKI